MNAADLESFARAVAERGWAITPQIIDDSLVAQLRAAVAPLATNGRGS